MGAPVERAILTILVQSMQDQAWSAGSGQIVASPYNWPHDASLSPQTTALVVIDMQRDFCEKGGYFDCQGYDVSDARAIIPVLQDLLDAARKSSLPVFFTREGIRNYTIPILHSQAPSSSSSSSF